MVLRNVSDSDILSIFVSCCQVNLRANHVEYSRFYIPDITSLVDIQEDYLKWFLSKAEIVSAMLDFFIWHHRLVLDRESTL